MANSTSHVLPYPIKGARFTLELSFRVAAGTPTDPTTPDTEFSSDGGASFADCAEEITTGGANGIGYLTLTGAETNVNLLAIAAKSANCVTSPAIIYPRVLASIGTGTLSAGSAGGGTLGTILVYDVTGCFIMTTGGTGGGGTGGANNQARRIVTYTPSTGAFTVTPNWETTPDATTTYNVLLPEGVTLGMLRTIEPTLALPTTPAANTYGEAMYLADILGGRFGTAQAGTASTITLDSGASAVDSRYVGYMVYLYGGTGGGVRGVGQARTITAYNGTTKVATVDMAWGTNPDNTTKFMLVVHPVANVGIWNFTPVATPATAGFVEVNASKWNNLATVALPLIPTTAGRTLDVSATGEAGVDWGNVGSPTTTLALIGTTIADTQKVDVNTIKTQTVTCAAGVTIAAFVGNATAAIAVTAAGRVDVGLWLGTAPLALSSQQVQAVVPVTQKVDVETIKTGAVVNAGTVTFPANSTLASTVNITTATVTTVGTGAIVAASFAAGAIDNAAIATDAIGSAELAASAVTEIQSGLSTLDAAGVRTAVGLASANLDTQLSAIAGYIDTEVAAIKAKTDNLPSDPADASDIATAFGTVNATLAIIAGYIDTEVGAIKAKTDQFVFTVANKVDANTLAIGNNVITAASLAADAGAEIADAVWDEAISGHLTAGSTGAALSAASAAGDPWNTALPGAYASGTAGFILGNVGGTVGPGSIEFTVTINDDMANPLDGAEVWVSTDSVGSNVIAGTLNTNASGQATFLLDAGSYWLWVSHSGYNRDNPSAFTVS